MSSPSLIRRAASGFTLIELLVVISIIGVLAAIITTGVAQARVRAENASVQRSVYQYVVGLNKIDAETGTYPVPADAPGYYCLGGSDCGYESDGDLNGTLSEQVSGAQNPNSTAVLFEGEYRRAAYLRCDDAIGTCDGDSITEVMWFLQGTDTDCGYGATAYYDSGNTACLLHLEGTGTLVNEALDGDEPETETACSDGSDNDNDGSSDCSDSDCSFDSYCTQLYTESGYCSDGLDNDNDGSYDCGDNDCSSDPICYTGPTSESGYCSDYSDNDNDGSYDCGDSDCSGDSYCQPTYYSETCNNGFDDDYDGSYDCSDSDCYWDSYCMNNSSGY
jgi:prepilin-type N-terminal cleavage/methylation domain-containing protein